MSSNSNCPATSKQLLNQKSTVSNDSDSDSDNERGAAGSDSTSPNCPICLSKCKKRCFTDPCLHQYCFECLLKWSKVKAECPLCKNTFRSIIHNVKSSDQYEEYLVTPPPLRRFHPESNLFRFTSGVVHLNAAGFGNNSMHNLQSYLERHPTNVVFGPESSVVVYIPLSTMVNMNNPVERLPPWALTSLTARLMNNFQNNNFTPTCSALTLSSATPSTSAAASADNPIVMTFESSQQQQQQPQQQQQQQMPSTSSAIVAYYAPTEGTSVSARSQLPIAETSGQVRTGNMESLEDTEIISSDTDDNDLEIVPS